MNRYLRHPARNDLLTWLTAVGRCTATVLLLALLPFRLAAWLGNLLAASGRAMVRLVVKGMFALLALLILANLGYGLGCVIFYPLLAH